MRNVIILFFQQSWSLALASKILALASNMLSSNPSLVVDTGCPQKNKANYFLADRHATAANCSNLWHSEWFDRRHLRVRPSVRPAVVMLRDAHTQSNVRPAVVMLRDAHTQSVCPAVVMLRDAHTQSVCPAVVMLRDAHTQSVRPAVVMLRDAHTQSNVRFRQVTVWRQTQQSLFSLLFSSLWGCLALRPQIGPNALPLTNQKPNDKGEGLYPP